MLPGAPALTTRGMKEADFVAVVGFIDEAVQIAQGVKAKTGKIAHVLSYYYARAQH